jgi:hypothetical protein
MKVVQLVFGIFFVAGLGMLAGGYFSVQRTHHFIAGAVTVQGVVVENVLKSSTNNDGTSWSYYPHVRFRTTEGRDIDFVSNAGSGRPSFPVNQPVAVLYDPQQPEKASINSFGQLWGLSLILGILGVVFTVPMLGFFIWKRKSDQKNQWLQQNGRRIQADITSVELNTSLQVNGRNPFRIVCQWLDTTRNEVHIFHSTNIWFDPSPFLPGKTLVVLLDPANPRRYLVETSFLPKAV